MLSDGKAVSEGSAVVCRRGVRRRTEGRVLQKMNVLLIYGGLTALLVVIGAFLLPKAPVSAIAFIVSVIVALLSVVLDLLDDGRLDPFFLMSMAAAWFLSLMVGLATGWLVEKGLRTHRSERD